MDQFLDFGDVKLPADGDPRVATLFGLVKDELRDAAWLSCERYMTLKKIRDQVDGERAALGKPYHEPIPGLKDEHQAMVEKSRRHVNLAEPALDRFVNSIHAGRIVRRSRKNADLNAILQKPAHRKAMGLLCENGFGYGTGVVIPLMSKGTAGKWRAKYWLPDPLWTVLAVDPMDVSRIKGVLEIVRNEVNTKTLGLRFVGEDIEGVYTYEGNKLDVKEHQMGRVPAVVAYGRDCRHRGKKYGKSLIGAAADASIDVTNNELNLKFMRDRLTQALLLIFGEPTNNEAENRESLQKFLMWLRRDDGDARYITPDSKILDVIELTRRFCADGAVSSGLPVDTFLPEMVVGGDASATAARWRAFPLQQKMVRLNNDWLITEHQVAGVIGALMGAVTVDPEAEWEDVSEDLGVEVLITPSIPEAEAELLAGWQQRTEKFFAPVEEAIEYYAGHLSEDQKAELARKWRIKYDPESGRKEVFQYHIEGGVLTVNEIRRTLGMDPVDWGNVTVPELMKEPAQKDEGEGMKGKDEGEG